MLKLNCNMMDRELNEKELEEVGMHPDKELNYEKAMKNKDLFRKKQIEELKKIKEELSPSADKRRR